MSVAPKKSSKTDQRGCIPAGQFPRVSDQRKVFGFRLYRWDVRTGQRLSNIRWLVGRAIRFLWYRLPWRPLACEIALELRSLFQRINAIYATASYLRGVSFGSVGGLHCDT